MSVCFKRLQSPLVLRGYRCTPYGLLFAFALLCVFALPFGDAFALPVACALPVAVAAGVSRLASSLSRRLYKLARSVGEVCPLLMDSAISARTANAACELLSTAFAEIWHR